MYFQIAQERSNASSVTKVCLTLFLQFLAQLLSDDWLKYNAFFLAIVSEKGKMIERKN